MGAYEEYNHEDMKRDIEDMLKKKSTEEKITIEGMMEEAGVPDFNSHYGKWLSVFERLRDEGKVEIDEGKIEEKEDGYTDVKNQYTRTGKLGGYEDLATGDVYLDISGIPEDRYVKRLKDGKIVKRVGDHVSCPYENLTSLEIS